MIYKVEEDAASFNGWSSSENIKLVLMQPYFFPYIGYFTLLKHTDVFVVFDTAQYIRRGWINRNQIIGPTGNPVYINASIIKKPQDALIKSMELSESAEWKKTVLDKLEFYKKTAPYYKEVRNLVSDCLEYPTASLSEFNINALIKVCDFLEINHNIKRLSEMGVEFKDIEKPDDWGLQLSKYYGAHTYVNASGGQRIYSKEKYLSHGVELVFYIPEIPPYDQKQESFHRALSIIDVLMFNSKEEVHEMIDAYEVI